MNKEDMERLETNLKYWEIDLAVTAFRIEKVKQLLEKERRDVA